MWYDKNNSLDDIYQKQYGEQVNFEEWENTDENYDDEDELDEIDPDTDDSRDAEDYKY